MNSARNAIGSSGFPLEGVRCLFQFQFQLQSISKIHFNLDRRREICLQHGLLNGRGIGFIAGKRLSFQKLKQSGSPTKKEISIVEFGWKNLKMVIPDYSRFSLSSSPNPSLIYKPFIKAPLVFVMVSGLFFK